MLLYSCRRLEVPGNGNPEPHCLWTITTCSQKTRSTEGRACRPGHSLIAQSLVRLIAILYARKYFRSLPRTVFPLSDGPCAATKCKRTDSTPAKYMHNRYVLSNPFHSHQHVLRKISRRIAAYANTYLHTVVDEHAGILEVHALLFIRCH